MITRKELIDYASLKNIELIEEAPATHLERYNNEGAKLNQYNTYTGHNYRIGIRYSQYCYYWFIAYLTDDDIEKNRIDMHFEHKYSQRNGSVDKRWNTGYKAITRINDILQGLK
jgi:hypothetical protein